MTAKPIFLPTVPERKPRTECGCQPVGFMLSARVAPCWRRIRSRTWAVLLPSRAAGVAPSGALGVFLAGLALFPDLSLAGATWARRAPVSAFLVALGPFVFLDFGSFVDFMVCPFAV